MMMMVVVVVLLVIMLNSATGIQSVHCSVCSVYV